MGAFFDKVPDVPLVLLVHGALFHCDVTYGLVMLWIVVLRGKSQSAVKGV